MSDMKSLSLTVQKLWPRLKFFATVTERTNIVAAFRGMHVSPAKHSFGKCDRRTDRQTDRRPDRRTTDKVIPMCRYASQATQKLDAPKFHSGNIKIISSKAYIWEAREVCLRRHTIQQRVHPGYRGSSRNRETDHWRNLRISSMPCSLKQK